MASARDPHDHWHDDHDTGDDAGTGWDRWPKPRPLELVSHPQPAFELVKPESFEAAQTIADSVRAGIPVLVDFHDCDPGLAGRLTDFCSGLAYAVEGALQHVGRDVLLIAAHSVDVHGDVASAVRSPGFYNRS
ncbi:MAG TPA: cell division protein SepF [Thermoleophilia bacterium]|nr:cell division protein SepF [Thermoleophilia bacterium]